MDIDTLRVYCLSKKAVTEELPFGPDALVFKVMEKMFALVSLDTMPLRVNLKCDPEEAIVLREEYDGLIIPGYHMNKKHWNTVIFSGKLSPKLIHNLIDSSYNLVVDKLTKKQKTEYNQL
ncbi:MmcQ/YjbR family DNA-binding protein [Zunongwangia sp.]|uniref:MmcQ/YjbR family DNA-binding protein n=1 Tax=Zunongwangia sp. TaxID=1965325 RepID=UPI003AA8DCE6